MTAAREEVLAELAYDAALRSQAVVAKSVQSFRSHIIFVVTGGSVAIGFFANAALKAPCSGDGWLIASAVSTGLFLITAMRALRLRKGVAKEIDPASLLKLPPTDGPSLRFAAARKVAANVADANGVLESAQRELYVVMTLLALSLGLWATAALTCH